MEEMTQRSDARQQLHTNRTKASDGRFGFFTGYLFISQYLQTLSNGLFVRLSLI
jgi:hypothetical protein